MKWIPDKTGRFRQRPYYTEDELDRICEDEITNFLRERHGTVAFPVSTSDLTIMIEQHVADLDNGCDLPDGQDGFTDFFPRAKPKVTIANRLQQSYLENRLRTTLTHEYGHVRLHGFLFQFDDGLQHLFDGKPDEVQSRCKHETIEGRAAAADWMEWQAGYACGALLMPKSLLTVAIKNFRQHRNVFADIGVNTETGQALIALIMQGFQVSRDAAIVRLKELKAVVENPSASLFQ